MAGSVASPTRGYAGRTAEDRKAERRDRLIATALELFGNDGYAATTIERLCAAAGVSTRNFYQEFGGREDLLIAVHEQITVESIKAVVQNLASTPDEPLRQRMELAVRTYVNVTARSPQVARVAYVEVVGVSAKVEQHRLAYRDKWAQLMQSEAHRAAQRGEAIDRDYRLTAYAIMGSVNEVVHRWSTHDSDLPLQSVVDELVRVILGVLTTR